MQFNGPVLELMTSGRARFDQRIAGLGPDILGSELDEPRFLQRADDRFEMSVEQGQKLVVPDVPRGDDQQPTAAGNKLTATAKYKVK